MLTVACAGLRNGAPPLQMKAPTLYSKVESSGGTAGEEPPPQVLMSPCPLSWASKGPGSCEAILDGGPWRGDGPWGCGKGRCHLGHLEQPVLFLCVTSGRLIFFICSKGDNTWFIQLSRWRQQETMRKTPRITAVSKARHLSLFSEEEDVRGDVCRRTLSPFSSSYLLRRPSACVETPLGP